MKNSNRRKSTIFSFIQLKKKFIKKLFNSIIILERLKNQFFQSLHFFLSNNYLLKYKKDFLISYIIYFCFSLSNTVLHISDATGNLKLSCSAGLIDLQGKQKVVRRLALTRFFNILSLAKSKFLKNNPVALHFKNVNGSNKFLIVKKLKQKFFIKTIKTFDLNAYNGCRKRKERRKR
uniref:Ribosomal protein S11 n=1 Tax=Pleurosigma intermedium TaxID=197753 RepID=A0A8F9R2Z6_9STRA|nr:ribosomal protein S11 [Pleurosigma sp. mgcode 4]